MPQDQHHTVKHTGSLAVPGLLCIFYALLQLFFQRVRVDLAHRYHRPRALAVICAPLVPLP